MNTEAIRLQTRAIDDLRKAVAATEKLIAQVSARHGQDCAVIHVNGVKFDLVALNSGYMPQVVKGMESIQQHCLDLLRQQLHGERSKLEGAEWKLRQLVKAA